MRLVEGTRWWRINVYMVVTVLIPLLRKPLRGSLRRFPFAPSCSLASGMDLGNRPSKERYCGNYDHRPFAEAIEELPPILLILCGHSVRRSVFLLIDFHEEALLVELDHVIAISVQQARNSFYKGLTPPAGGPPEPASLDLVLRPAWHTDRSAARCFVSRVSMVPMESVDVLCVVVVAPITVAFFREALKTVSEAFSTRARGLGDDATHV
jgi:hypothetical protein